MFFYLSKLFWLVASPANLLVILAGLGAALCFTRFVRFGRALAVLAVFGLVLAGFGPLGSIIARPLEDRFPRTTLPADVAGIIVLGGGIGSARGEPTFNSAASRMTASVDLARRYPAARIAFTGGSAAVLMAAEMSEAEAARRFYLSQGIAPERLILEDQSRNTVENAALLKPMLNQQPGEAWLLVTSALHMPRSVGIFRKAGIAIIPYPVDYVTTGTPRDYFRPNRELINGLERTDRAVKEWLGLLAYHLAGYTDALLPGPR